MQRIKKLFSIVILMLSDVAALLASFLMAYFLRSQLLLSIVPRFKNQESLPLDMQLRLGFAYGAVVIILVMFYGGLYTQRFSFWEETKYLLKNVSISFIFILVLVFVSRQYIFFSRATIFLAWLLSMVVFPIFRGAIKKFLVRTGLWKIRVIIFGTNDTSRLLAAGIASSRTLGYEIVGFLSEKEREVGKTFCGVDVVGSISDGKKISRQMNVRDFIVSLPSFSQEELVKVMEDCDEYADTIRMVPNIGSLFTLGVWE
jgi:FlaA1/EpsC-like NDP-sugar epimerase